MTISALRLLPTPIRLMARNAWDEVTTAIYSVGKPIPTPPAKFRALVNGGSIDPEGHALIGREMFELVRQHCELQPSSIVLDIGCGCGRVATPLASYMTSGTYHGVDIVQPMVEWCKQNISRPFPNFYFHHANLSNTLYRQQGRDADSYVFPFSDRMFDVIFATSVFTHLVPNSAKQYAKEVARMLKPSGRAMITFFLEDNKSETPRIVFHRCDGYSVVDISNPEAAIAYDETEARSMLSNAGLSVEELSRGQWSGHSGWTFQDVFIVASHQKPVNR
jgi:ubiquinone/menaquinone biosynthesis C-methylase UbiE